MRYEGSRFTTAALNRAWVSLALRGPSELQFLGGRSLRKLTPTVCIGAAGELDKHKFSKNQIFFARGAAHAIERTKRSCSSSATYQQELRRLFLARQLNLCCRNMADFPFSPDDQLLAGLPALDDELTAALGLGVGG